MKSPKIISHDRRPTTLIVVDFISWHKMGFSKGYCKEKAGTDVISRSDPAARERSACDTLATCTQCTNTCTQTQCTDTCYLYSVTDTCYLHLDSVYRYLYSVANICYVYSRFSVHIHAYTCYLYSVTDTCYLYSDLVYTETCHLYSVYRNVIIATYTQCTVAVATLDLLLQWKHTSLWSWWCHLVMQIDTNCYFWIKKTQLPH